MKAVVQRVNSARVQVGDQTVGEIGRGLLIYLGVAHGDGPEQVAWLAEKILHLRIFDFRNGRDYGDIVAPILVAFIVTDSGAALAIRGRDLFFAKVLVAKGFGRKWSQPIGHVAVPIGGVRERNRCLRPHPLL